MKSYPPGQIRNVGLFGHGGTGKTTLSEAILFATGAISRMGRVEEGTTTSDFDPDETKRHISVNLSLLPCEWQDTKINLIDVPGYADFVGEVHEALRVVESAVFVLSAPAGVEVGAELIWRAADAVGGPSRFVVVNKMDRENADFAKALAEAQERLSAKCVAVQLPIGSQDKFQGVIDLVCLKAYLGDKGTEAPIPAELQGEVASLREKLVEAVAETDDDLIAKYLEGEELTEAEIVSALGQAVASGAVVPVLAASALGNKAIPCLLNALVQFGPAPTAAPPVTARAAQGGNEESLTADPNGPLAALVFKTTADPHVGKLTYFRVFSGSLRSDSRLWNSSRGKEERIGQVFIQRGKVQEPTSAVGAGDIGVVAKLAETATGDTLCASDHPLLLEPIKFPAPLFSAALHPRGRADVDKLGPALTRIVEEDPTLQVRRDPDTAETVLSGIGESHVDVAVEKMKRKFGVEVTTSLPKVSYKETISLPVKRAEYKHKKQTGGHGQYGHVVLELEPLPRGSGVEFAERVVGGVVPKNFIPAVEKGINEAVPEGPVAGFPIVDVKVTLYDGSYHAVDSSEMSFKLASAQALKKGISDGKPVLLEPIMNLRVVVPDAFTGDTMSDLNGKRARVQGVSPQDGVSIIEAQAPLAELRRYATDLRSITQGRGRYELEFSHYEEVPAHVAQQVIAEAKKAGEG